MTVNDFQFIEVESRHSADTIASELTISGYIVKSPVVYKDVWPHAIAYYHLEFYKPKKKPLAGKECDD